MSHLPRVRFDLKAASDIQTPPKTLSKYKTELSIMQELNEEIPSFLKSVALRRAAEIVRKPDTKTLKEAEHFLDAIISSVVKNKGKVGSLRIDVTTKGAETTLKLLERVKFASKSLEFIRSMSLVYLISIFEGFLQEMLMSLLLKHPAAISDQKSLTAEELSQCRNIPEAIRKVSEKEASIAVNEDIEEVNRYVKGKFGMDLSKFVDWKEFKERFYRRNLIIHNSSLVNQLYRTKTGRSRIGVKLEVDKEYLSTSINMFATTGEKIWKHAKHARSGTPAKSKALKSS